MRRIIGILLAVMLIASTLFVGVALANHNGAVVTSASGECGQTTFSATITDPAGTHKVSNMYLVVDASGETQVAHIPIDGSISQISVGPFFDNTTISWRVFGGGERGYDQPLWNGFGTPTFNADIANYALSIGSYDWVIAGVDNPNPFTTWDTMPVEGCATKAQCMDDGWIALGFRNQGQCIRFVNTGFDSR